MFLSYCLISSKFEKFPLDIEADSEFIQLFIKFWVQWRIFFCFIVLIYSAQQISTAKIPVVSLKLKEKAGRLRVTETKPDTENASNWNFFAFRVKKKSKFNKRALFLVFLESLDFYLNPYKKDSADLRF